METLTLIEPGRMLLTQTEAPDRPPAGHAVVRVLRVGVCGTDLHAFRGRQPFFTYPRVLGHELGVEVVALASDVPPSELAIGDRCAVEPYLNCGACIACRRGTPNCCVHLRVLGVHVDGGMREFITVPAHKLHRSNVLSFDQLALIETLAIGAHAVDRAAVVAGETVLVIGAGPIGLTVIQFALTAGARVIALDLDARRLAFCQRQLGVEFVVPGGDGAMAEVRAITDDDLPVAVFDATGNLASMTEAFGYVAHGGRLVFVGLVQGDVSFHDPEFHRQELTLLASRNATTADFRRIIGLAETGQVDPAGGITHRVPFASAAAQFPDWVRPESGVIKALMTR